MELIDANQLGPDTSLDTLKKHRFIEDLNPLIEELSELYTVEYVTSLELFSEYSTAYSGVSEIWL